MIVLQQGGKCFFERLDLALLEPDEMAYTDAVWRERVLDFWRPEPNRFAAAKPTKIG